MMLCQLTRHSKLSTMCSQVTRYFNWPGTVCADQSLPSPCSVVSGWVGVLLELGSHASLHNATDEINILLVGMLHDGDTSI